MYQGVKRELDSLKHIIVDLEERRKFASEIAGL
jgi:hypothetical protein